MQKIKGLKLLAVLAVLAVAAFAGQAQATNVLITQFDYDGYTTMQSNLQALGHTVDIVNAKTAGNIALALQNKSYDQVFFWDLTGAAYVNTDDITSLTGFFATRNSLVVDTRSYGYHFQGTNASEVALLQNISNAFSARSGGLWIGTDHDPDWTRNANPLLSALGINPVTGNYSYAVNNYDPDSILLAGVTVTDLWAAGQSVGEAPLGIQPNGLDMRFHFGHSSSQYGAVPYITASFGTYVAPDENRPPENGNGGDPAIPEPASMLLLGSGLLGLVGLRKKRS